MRPGFGERQKISDRDPPHFGHQAQPTPPGARTHTIEPSSPLTLVRYSCDSEYTVDMQRLLPPPATHPALARGEGPAIVRIARIAAPEERTAPPNLATATDAMVKI